MPNRLISTWHDCSIRFKLSALSWPYSAGVRRPLTEPSAFPQHEVCCCLTCIITISNHNLLLIEEIRWLMFSPLSLCSLLKRSSLSVFWQRFLVRSSPFLTWWSSYLRTQTLQWTLQMSRHRTEGPVAYN